MLITESSSEWVCKETFVCPLQRHHLQVEILKRVVSLRDQICGVSMRSDRRKSSWIETTPTVSCSSDRGDEEDERMTGSGRLTGRRTENVTVSNSSSLWGDDWGEWKQQFRKKLQKDSVRDERGCLTVRVNHKLLLCAADYFGFESEVIYVPTKSRLKIDNISRWHFWGKQKMKVQSTELNPAETPRLKSEQVWLKCWSSSLIT